MATVIGTVTGVQGMAFVVDANGNRHMLQVGEVLYAGDKVITASGANVTVKLVNGETLNFAEAQTIKITDNMAQVDVSEGINCIPTEVKIKSCTGTDASGQCVPGSADVSGYLNAIENGKVTSSKSFYISWNTSSTSVSLTNRLECVHDQT